MTDLRVLVDARWVSLAPQTSHARYLRALAAEWVQLPNAPSLTLVGPGARPSGLATNQRLRWLSVPDLPGRWKGRPGSRLWSNTVFTAIAAARRPDVLFFPWSVTPKLMHAPAVVTVHDVCFRSHPERFPDNGRAGDAVLAEAVRASRVILTPSLASKRGVVAAYGLDEARVRVVHHGISPVFRQKPACLPAWSSAVQIDDATVLQRLDVKLPYVLCVSTHEPRKNLGVLVHAFVQHVEQQPDSQLRLVLVGRRSYDTIPLVQALSLSPVARERTHFVNGVSDEELASLYRLASAAVLPSVCEGFGFPLLEALACGTPVVASDLAVFRELVDHAAIYVPWHAVDAWVAALERVTSDTDLKLQALAGAARITCQYTWRTSAVETLEALRLAAS